MTAIETLPTKKVPFGVDRGAANNRATEEPGKELHSPIPKELDLSRMQSGPILENRRVQRMEVCFRANETKGWKW